MSKRPKAGAGGAGVQLFPFLAVLLCTMGALILLLMLIAQQARATAEAEAEAAAHTARLEAAYGMASQAIPDAQNAIPAALEFAAEFNYTPEEIANVSDGRDIVMLHLARLAGNLIKGGHMDASGRMLSLPEPVSQKPTDPRLQDRAPLATLGTTAGSASAPSNNVEDELNAILNMSEAEMAKLDPDKLQKLLGAAMGQ